MSATWQARLLAAAYVAGFFAANMFPFEHSHRTGFNCWDRATYDESEWSFGFPFSVATFYAYRQVPLGQLQPRTTTRYQYTEPSNAGVNFCIAAVLAAGVFGCARRITSQAFQFSTRALFVAMCLIAVLFALPAAPKAAISAYSGVLLVWIGSACVIRDAILTRREAKQASESREKEMAIET